ncbi:MAG: choice-of-anchor I family protein [Xanthomonadales bacterium]|nr:choice-of-anchor I family protein [Xanthomonadales bacterium]
MRLALLMSITLAAAPLMAAPQTLNLTRIGGYDSSLGEGASEIVAYDPGTAQAFVVNAVAATVDAVDLSNPATPVLIRTIDVSGFGAVANSVAVSQGRVAIAVEANNKQDPGQLVFFDLSGNLLGAVGTGALPDNVVFTPNGRYALVANEGEPNDDYDVDPEGSITIVDLAAGVPGAVVSHVGFSEFNVGGPRAAELPAAVRIYGPGATVAQDLEPEYIAANDQTAFVSLQENNAIARIDIASAAVEAIFALGSKDHSVPGQGLDPSDRDSGIEIGNWPVNGLYQPDTIGLIERNGVPYVLSANEGDTRDYDGYSEESRVSGLDLDPTAFPNAATLQANAALGRLTVTEANGDDDGDGDFDQLFVPGGRSFSIWEGVGGTQVYDSGDDFEQVTAAQVPALFNSQGDPGSFDNRSDNKGPEPEALTVGNVGGREFAFIGMERIGGVFAYDVEQPGAPELVSYSPAQGGDVSPEGMSFVPAALSPNGRALLLVAHEVSGTLGVYQVDACVVSAIVVNPLTVTVVGDCPGGFDLYRNGLLLQSGLVLNGALVLPLESLVGDRYFAALPGDNQPINGVVGSVVALQVPSLGTIGVIALGMLLVFMGGVALARKP